MMDTHTAAWPLIIAGALGYAVGAISALLLAGLVRVLRRGGRK